MRARTLGLALALAASGACSSSGPAGNDRGEASLVAAAQVVGRWTLEGEGSLSSLVTGFDLTAEGEGLSGRIYLSGLVLPATGRLTADGFTLTPDEGRGPSIQGRLQPDGAVDATVTATGLPDRRSRFVRVP